MNTELRLLVEKYNKGGFMTFDEYGRMLNLLLEFYATHG